MWGRKKKISVLKMNSVEVVSSKKPMEIAEKAVWLAHCLRKGFGEDEVEIFNFTTDTESIWNVCAPKNRWPKPQKEEIVASS